MRIFKKKKKTSFIFWSLERLYLFFLLTENSIWGYDVKFLLLTGGCLHFPQSFFTVKD